VQLTLPPNWKLFFPIAERRNLFNIERARARESRSLDDNKTRQNRNTRTSEKLRGTTFPNNA
jgi:hypothetical protein